MKTEIEIKERLEKIKKDERLTYPEANAVINTPLAMIQAGLKQQIEILEWVLDIKTKTDN